MYVYILISLLTIVAIYMLLHFLPAMATDSIPITNTTLDGKKQVDTSISVPRSFDQADGLVFAYAGWVMINDFSYKQGTPRTIFVKGSPDVSTACPALVIDANSNTLLVRVDTFGATEIIPVSNVPAKKWLHFAIVAKQDAIDVYINGKLYEHHTITQMPRQNDETVHVATGGGFDGQLSLLSYYNYALTSTDIDNLMKTTPTSTAPVLPPYFSNRWWKDGRSRTSYA